MKISRTVAYALQATLLLARSKTGSPVPCSRLAVEGKMPERFLLQILRNLASHGILESTHGVDGGYMLGRPPAEITLLQVIEAIDGPLATALPLGGGLPRGSKTKLEAALGHVTETARRELAAIRLSSLLPDGEA